MMSDGEASAKELDARIIRKRRGITEALVRWIGGGQVEISTFL